MNQSVCLKISRSSVKQTHLQGSVMKQFNVKYNPPKEYISESCINLLMNYLVISGLIVDIEWHTLT